MKHLSVVVAVTLMLGGCAGLQSGQVGTQIHDAVAFAASIAGCVETYADSLLSPGSDANVRISAGLAAAACINDKIQVYVAANPSAADSDEVKAGHKAVEGIRRAVAKAAAVSPKAAEPLEPSPYK